VLRVLGKEVFILRLDIVVVFLDALHFLLQCLDLTFRVRLLCSEIADLLLDGTHLRFKAGFCRLESLVDLLQFVKLAKTLLVLGGLVLAALEVGRQSRDLLGELVDLLLLGLEKQ
jgi:hypothetical protein